MNRNPSTVCVPAGDPQNRGSGEQVQCVLQPTYSYEPVLCVDLDGTLVRSDLAWECVITLLKVQPLALLLIPVWLLGGIARCKEELAKRSRLDVARLPYREEVLAFLRIEHERGRRIALVTAADVSLAKEIANQIGVFECVYGTCGGVNLKGEAKAELLQKQFGNRGYDYVGDSVADLPAWKSAVAAYVVGDQGLTHKVRSVIKVERAFQAPAASLGTWLRALRGLHWAKNLLLFLPLLLAHRLEWGPLLNTAMGFVLFSLCASSIYILNDLLDLHSDRAHPWKARRPFASGEISIPSGLAISSLLISATIAAGFLLRVEFGAVLILYVVATFWYSIHLKRILLLDVFVLSSFYTIRIWAGSVVASVPVSDWFLMFSSFFFFSLATAKRYSELVHAGALAEEGISGRAYIEGDHDLLMNLGISSSFSAVIILALYAHSQEFLLLYRNSGPMLLVCAIILYWQSRLWLKARRGDLDEDPITLSFRDPLTYVVGGIIFIVLALSSKGL